VVIHKNRHINLRLTEEQYQKLLVIQKRENVLHLSDIVIQLIIWYYNAHEEESIEELIK
jgi:hypothetical protein